MHKKGTETKSSTGGAAIALVAQCLLACASSLVFAEGSNSSGAGIVAPLAAAKDWLETCRSPNGDAAAYCVACISVGGSRSGTESPRGFCIASDLTTNTAGVANFSVANDVPITHFNYSQTPNAGQPPAAGIGQGVGRCTSVGGSDAAPDAGDGFCLAADLRLSDGVPLAFALANGSEVTGIQFMQVSFRHGAETSGIGTPGQTTCETVTGSSALTPTGSGFCMSAHLLAPTDATASLTVGNELPIAGVQLLQVSLGRGAASSTPGSISGAVCASGGGTRADSGATNGFCLAADLTSVRSDVAGLSFAHKLPMKGLQFVQMTFAGTNDTPLDTQLLSGNTASTGNCLSSNGSSAHTDAVNGFCLSSSLSSTGGATADISIANGLPIASMQFLQASFSANSPLANITDPQDAGANPSRANCRSLNGTRASIGNPSGFCIASDRGLEASGLAHLALANELPVGAMQFLQVPVGTSTADQLPNSPLRPRGMLISDRALKRAGTTRPPAVGAAGMQPARYYGIHAGLLPDRTLASVTSRWPRNLSFWINKKIRAVYRRPPGRQ